MAALPPRMLMRATPCVLEISMDRVVAFASLWTNFLGGRCAKNHKISFSLHANDSGSVASRTVS